MLGTLPQWRNEADRQAALEALERDAHAASTREAMHAKLRTVGRALAGWGLPMFPHVIFDPSVGIHVETGRIPTLRLVPLALQG